MVLQSSKDSEDEKMCGFCKKKIDENYVSTESEVYHVKCFYCSFCKESLAGKAFVQKEDSFQCETCYKKINTKTCAHCKEIITGQYLTALGKDWHMDHFVCVVCSKPNTSTYRTYKDEPYCDTCYLKKIISKCATCNTMISMNEKMIEVGDKKLHEKCFVCGFDQKPIDSKQSIKMKDGKVYCEEHYTKHIATRCAVCKEVIQGFSLTTADKSFHEKCFNCQKCGKPLKDAQSSFYNDMILCNEDILSMKEEKKRKEEEEKKLLEEQKRKEEEEKKLLEEQKREEEEAWKLLEELKLKEEEAKKLLEEQKLKEEEAKKLLEEQKLKEEEEKKTS